MRVLVTGGAGYIGSHAVVALQQAGHEIVVVDNLCHSSAAVLPRIEALSGKKIDFVAADLNDKFALERIFSRFDIDAVMHFAALKAVNESRAQAARFYHNNVGGTLCLLEVMEKFHCKRLVFSSSAVVYGIEQSPPFFEHMPLKAQNPYGHTKVMSEQILKDMAAADGEWHVIALRYCNPIGAHPSGTIGEAADTVPNNLLPYVAKVACGQLPLLKVFGGDYETVDGTGVRDFVHVMDLAEGHCRALDKLAELEGFHAVNLGTGKGVSVLELITTFEQVCQRPVAYQIAPRREGDIPAFWADVQLAEQLLQWRSKRDLRQMLEDAWRWQCANPYGYMPAESKN